MQPRAGIGGLIPSLILTLFLLIQLGCASIPPVGSTDRRVDKVQALKREISSIRGLSFHSEVRIEAKNKEAMVRQFEAGLNRQYGERGLGNLSLFYKKIGLLPRDLDLKSSLLDFYGANAVGFYDSLKKKLVLRYDVGRAFIPGPVRVISGTSDLGERVLVHELTHALQDQNFSLNRRLRESFNGDRVLAFRAVAEGDATLAEFGYLFGGMNEGFASYANHRLRGKIKQTRANLSDVPRFIADRFLFQYFSGTSFVSLLLDEYGWDGINHLYASPPQSTEQVLHPEKYLYEPDPPTRVNINDLASLFSSEWEAIGNNTLGEVMVRCLFNGFLSPGETEAVGNGWDGDRYWAFRRGEEISFVWVTVWDSNDDAREFVQNYRQVLSMKYGSAESALGHSYLEQRGDVVMLVEGLERSRIVKGIEPLWQRLELEEESFNLPIMTSSDGVSLWLDEPEPLNP